MDLPSSSALSFGYSFTSMHVNSSELRGTSSMGSATDGVDKDCN